MAIELVVVTPEGEALSETVQQVVLPGEAGEFGVLESHERFLTPLQLGPMEIIRDSGNEWACLLYTSPSPRDKRQSRMPSSA